MKSMRTSQKHLWSAKVGLRAYVRGTPSLPAGFEANAQIDQIRPPGN